MLGRASRPRLVALGSILSASVLSTLTTLADGSRAVAYTALSDAARKAGRLARYEKCALNRGRLTLGRYALTFDLPKSARAYDVIPIRYALSQPAGSRRAAIEAVAFEDAKKAEGRSLYDLAIPGNMAVKIEYLGSVCADFDNERYIPLTADPKTPVSPFPPFKRDSMVRSSVLRQAQAVWFKFRITNNGDTILAPEGFGASFAEPRLTKLGSDGKEEWSAGTVNNYERHLNYIYPGESVEQWVNFYTPKFGVEWCRGLKEGGYRIDFRMLYRYHREYLWGINIWTGAEFARLEVPIRVTSKGGIAPVRTEFKVTDAGEKMPCDFDTFEEFMTSFRIYPPANEYKKQMGVLYLQVAPWTKNVAVKLILTDPKEIAATRIPIKISTETLTIRHNPANVMVINSGAEEEPAIVAQAMPGMRTGFQLGPYPEKHMLREIAEMKALGVNVIANTAGGWWIPEITGRKGVELHSACYKYWYDVLVRKLGLKLMGWSLYPPSGRSWYDHAGPLLGREIKYSVGPHGYGFPANGSVDMGDPIVPEVIAAWTRYNYSRWGDLWFRTADGRVPIDVEDTWGWMRDDINVRYHVGPLAIQRFRDWCRAKYGEIGNANAAWGSSYASFDEIDPEANQGIEGDGLTHGPVYNNKEHAFHDWSAAVEDWDTFRTELRMEILKKANRLIRKFIPSGELAVRSEGANLVIRGDGRSDNMHWRHVYYSQRRNAMVFDVVQKANVLHFYSDYTTLPYTEDEWRQAMREMVAAGVIPVFLPQFDHMRDILLNPHYGREYQMHYNLDTPTKGIMVHCLMAAYPWWKATYEEGGAPGIIWSDYACDGFATETQKRELKLLRDAFRRMRPTGTSPTSPRRS